MKDIIIKVIDFMQKWGMWILLIVVGLFLINKFQSCNIPVGPTLGPFKLPVVVATPAKTRMPTEEEKKLVPLNHTIKTVIDIKAPTFNKFTDDKIKLLVHVDSSCNTCEVNYTEVHTYSTRWGFDFEPKILAGYTYGGLTVAYDQGIFRYSRITLDTVVGFPIVGVGIGYNITNNFYILGGGVIRYLQYDKLSDISSYNFDAQKLTSIYPIGGIGFTF